MHIPADDSSAAAQQKQGQSKDHPSSSSDPDPTYVIQAAGFPWIATKPKIVEFFNGINILNGTNGIHFKIDKTKNSYNDAFIQLATHKDYQSAMSCKVKFMGSVPVKSNIFFNLVFGVIRNSITKNM